MYEVADDLERAIPDLAATLEVDAASSRSLHSATQMSLGPIRDLLTTRVIALGDEPDLVRRLMELERHERTWRDWIDQVEHWGAPDRLAWEEALATLRAAVGTYLYFVEHR